MWLTVSLTTHVVRQPARASDAALIPENQERLQRACDGMVATIQSLQFPLCAPPLARSLASLFLYVPLESSELTARDCRGGRRTCSEARLIWSHLRSCVRRLHRATTKSDSPRAQRASGDVDPTAAGNQEATTTDDEEAAKDEDKVSLLAVGGIAIMRTGFPMFSTRQMLEKLSLQQKRNLLMAAKMLQLLVTHQPADPRAQWNIKAPHWQGMHGWLEANRSSIDNVLTLSSVLWVRLLDDASWLTCACVSAR